jgi:Uma2 family endonuclease
MGGSAIPMPHWRFSLADYELMIETGILTEDDRVELIQGEIVEMSPIGAKHVACVNDISHLLNRRAGNDVIVQVQNPIVLPDGSAPQPDLALIHGHYDRGGLPTVADVLLVIEVADTSRDYDRTTKLPLYAAAGVPEAWLFDLVAERIERHTEPGPDGYQLIALAGRGKSLRSLVLSGVTLAIDEVLPVEE